MLVDVLATDGKKSGQIELLDDVFGITPNEAVIHDSIVTFLANQRQGTKSALTRAEVSGGGCKPWRQKGTGHARQGSTRAPQWRHGGIVFAVKPRDFSCNLNKKVRRLAICSILSKKAQNGDLIIIDNLSMNSYRTKSIVELMNSLNVQNTSLVLPESNKFVVKSASNIKKMAVLTAESMNSYDIFYHKNLIILKDAVSKIHEIFGSKNAKDKKVVA